MSCKLQGGFQRACSLSFRRPEGYIGLEVGVSGNDDALVRCNVAGFVTIRESRDLDDRVLPRGLPLWTALMSRYQLCEGETSLTKD